MHTCIPYIYLVCLFLFQWPRNGKFFGLLYLNSHLTLSEYSLNREEGVASRMYIFCLSISNREAVVAFGMYVFCLSISFVHWPRRREIFGLLYRNSHLNLTEYSLNCEEGVASRMYIFCLFISFFQWPRRGKKFGLFYLNSHLTFRSECSLNVNQKTI